MDNHQRSRGRSQAGRIHPLDLTRPGNYLRWLGGLATETAAVALLAAIALALSFLAFLLR